MELTDEQWAVLEPLIPEAPRREDGKGRPRRQAREVLTFSDHRNAAHPVRLAPVSLASI